MDHFLNVIKSVRKTGYVFAKEYLVLEHMRTPAERTIKLATNF